MVKGGAFRMIQPWLISHRADPDSRAIADRHYNRQKIGATGFVPPGRCLVLRLDPRWGSALWVTSWPFAAYVRHAWAGHWVNSCFRNEGGDVIQSSWLIRRALAATVAKWPEANAAMITFIDPSKVRHKRDLGRCYRRAGFRPVGSTKGGLAAFELPASEMPEALPAGYGGLFAGQILKPALEETP